MSGDFAGVNAQEVTRRVEAAVSQSARSMIEYLAGRGVSMSYIERALRLPQRTLARWKGGECSAPAIALLRLIRTYPWLLSVADESFDAAFAKQTLVIEAGKALAQSAAENQIASSVSFAPAQPVDDWKTAARLTPLVAEVG